MHSGVFGGAVPEAMAELSHIFASLIDPATGKIQIEGIYDQVDPVTADEQKLYSNIDFDMRLFELDGNFSKILVFSKPMLAVVD